MRLRAPFVTTFSVAVIAACAGSSSDNGCPQNGSPCGAATLVTNSACSSAGDWFQCQDGVWCEVPMNPPNPPVGFCPPVAPMGGAPCGAAFGVCNYRCSGGDVHRMTCKGGSWCGNTPAGCVLN